MDRGGRRYRHDERGIRALCARLLGVGVSLVAIERLDRLLIERLLDAGLSVSAVHPNQVVASRPRFHAAGGKSDSFDSFVLAELPRTESHRFRVLAADSDQTKALRALTRRREDLIRARQGLASQLRAQLECFWPGATKVFTEIDCPTALAFLARYPSPGDARGLGEQRLAAFLRRHGYSGGRKPAELLERLRGAARGRAGELGDPGSTPDPARARRALKPLGEQIEQLRVEIRRALLEHPDGHTFRSLFIDDRTVLCQATILAEMADRRDRYQTYRQLAADGAQAPVAVESGNPSTLVPVGVRSPPSRSDRHARGLKPTPQPWAKDKFTRG